MTVSLILPAAGLGTRMTRTAEGEKKQFMLLDGVPILVHTIRKFIAAGSIREIVVAARPEDMASVQDMLRTEPVPVPVRVVTGGDTRQESVENALRSLRPPPDLVAVHDAVRPFIATNTIRAVIAEAAAHGAAITGIVPVDTVKQVGPPQSGSTKIRATIPRDHLVLAQTPQVFSYRLLVDAFAAARADGFQGTDESSLVERLETVEVRVVQGSEHNIKITRPGDLEIARLLLRMESEKSA
ncbi:MAG: 2-C-methyl-D-erythritol 4-phosphate cytidylyltransferase [Bryobacterales bacterium]|jgi:2-C-methyl-D-erythritol 4-phosphate cytidylyltransferase|nr:2-C-methyl-D-erythritol 4-phosphate cytidylyltransferase [Bryobacterales bacterium]